jgi:hypothetical protein
MPRRTGLGRLAVAWRGYTISWVAAFCQPVALYGIIQFNKE